jgi:hypothetical protein
LRWEGDVSGLIYAKPIFSSRSINGQASAVPTAIDLRFIQRAEGLLMRVSKTGGTGNIKVQYAISRNGSTVDGSYLGNASIVTASAQDFPLSAKVWNAIPLPNFLSLYVFLKFSGATGNPATGVTVDAELVVRGSLLA